MSIRLTIPELRQAGMTGLSRYIEALAHNRTPVNGQDGVTSAGDHITGAFAEAAVARSLNVYWLGEWDNHKALDVCYYQVRHTKWDTGHLLIQKDDNPEEPYILVTGTPPEFTIRGYIYAKEAQVAKYWKAPKKGRPCYMVPQSDLRPVPGLTEE